MLHFRFVNSVHNVSCLRLQNANLFSNRESKNGNFFYTRLRSTGLPLTLDEKYFFLCWFYMHRTKVVALIWDLFHVSLQHYFLVLPPEATHFRCANCRESKIMRWVRSFKLLLTSGFIRNRPKIACETHYLFPFFSFFHFSIFTSAHKIVF